MNPTYALARVLLVAATAFTCPALAAAPAAPAVSVHAGLKQLQFTWNRVPEATRYELWFNPTTGASWVKYTELPLCRTSLAVNISAHLLNWQNARYVLKACNASGCGRSLDLGVSHLMQQTLGHFKPAAQLPRRWMGRTMALSEDGGTIAATIETNQSGGVEVFRKSPAGWAYEARLLADPHMEQDLTVPADPAVDISGDGNVVALGIALEVRPGAQPDSSTGAVYMFRRTSAGWVREGKLTFPDSLHEDQFGWRVDLDESGTLLAAWRRSAIEMFRRSTAGWTRVASLPAGCDAIGLSGDGGTLVRSCGSYGVEVFTAPGWQRVALLPNEVFSMEYSESARVVAVSHDGRSLAARSVTLDEEGVTTRAWVNVFRLGASGWVREATLGAPDGMPTGDPANPNNRYGLPLSMSRDGRFLAVGSYAGVLIYERKSSGWSLRRFIDLPYTSRFPDPLFGASVSFGRNGKDLAVGAAWETSDASVDFNPPGAVWLY